MMLRRVSTPATPMIKSSARDNQKLGQVGMLRSFPGGREASASRFLKDEPQGWSKKSEHEFTLSIPVELQRSPNRAKLPFAKPSGRRRQLPLPA